MQPCRTNLSPFARCSTVDIQQNRYAHDYRQRYDICVQIHRRCSPCSITVDTYGAQLLSWKPRGHREVFFCSSQIGQNPEHHAGIPICAPWFGRGRDGVEVPHVHGLVRWVPWQLTREVCEPDSITQRWELAGAAVTGVAGADLYPPDLRYTYIIEAAETLDLTLTIESPTTPVDVDMAFHSYFAVTDLANVTITGLTDTMARTDTDEYAHSGPLHLDGHHDVIYFDGGRLPLDIHDVDRTIRVLGYHTRDAIIWNPGPEYAKNMAGFGDDEWRAMVCVELGNVQRHARPIAAGGSVTVGMSISVVSQD